jgi:hypothetical protein
MDRAIHDEGARAVDGVVLQGRSSHRLRGSKGQQGPPRHGVPLQSERRTMRSPATMNSVERLGGTIHPRRGKR